MTDKPKSAHPKVDPEDLHNLAEDLKGVIQRHPDAIHAEPEITNHIVKARDMAFDKYLKVTEHKK